MNTQAILPQRTQRDTTKGTKMCLRPFRATQAMVIVSDHFVDINEMDNLGSESEK